MKSPAPNRNPRTRSPMSLRHYTFLILYSALAICALGAQTAQTAHTLIPRAQWTPFPRIDDRDAWENKADKTSLEAHLKFAAENIDCDWPAIPATLSLAFVRDGNRTRYESISFRKRAMLSSFLIAELAEDKGRFIDPIINAIWSICEESWWGVPAHLPATPNHAGLADTSDPIVDLFAAIAGELLAWTDYFLGERLDAVSPQIRKRIRDEITARILQPALAKHHWWMGVDYRNINNWTPWICSNWLVAALLIETDEATRAAHVAKISRTLDRYLASYPHDGGCDEGPSYWGVAGGSLYDSLAMLNLATNGAFNNMFSDEKNATNYGIMIPTITMSPRSTASRSPPAKPSRRPRRRFAPMMPWRSFPPTSPRHIPGPPA